MFSREYLEKMSQRTSFPAETLQKQMTLLDLLREISRHPLLRRKFVLKGGTAINLFWFSLPRLSVDIDLNYVASADRNTMLKDRPVLEKALKKLIESRGISVEHAPADEHAGGKWRLRAPSAFGGNFTLEIDLNYLKRIPVSGLHRKRPFKLDEDYVFDFDSVTLEELFAGKVRALSCWHLLHLPKRIALPSPATSTLSAGLCLLADSLPAAEPHSPSSKHSITQNHPCSSRLIRSPLHGLPRR